jgi:hypothetical protein
VIKAALPEGIAEEEDATREEGVAEAAQGRLFRRLGVTPRRPPAVEEEGDEGEAAYRVAHGAVGEGADGIHPRALGDEGETPDRGREEEEGLSPERALTLLHEAPFWFP